MKPKSLLTRIGATSKLAVLVAAVTVLTVGVAVLGRLAERHAHAFGACNHCRNMIFGMVGIAPGQTARLNIFIPDGAPNMVSLSFVDSNGAQLIDPVSAQPAQTNLILSSGPAASLDLAYPSGSASGPFASGGRVEIRALVEVSSVDGDQDASEVVSDLELFDTATGKTSVVLFPHNPS
jgi:hypothetical protein